MTGLNYGKLFYLLLQQVGLLLQFSQMIRLQALGAIVSLALLILNTYTKNFNLIETAQEHKVASDLLWKIREEYVSLLTDFEIMDADKIMNKRDELQERTAEVYSNSPRTDIKSYRAAQKALKTEDEQTFSEEEIEIGRAHV